MNELPLSLGQTPLLRSHGPSPTSARGAAQFTRLPFHLVSPLWARRVLRTRATPCLFLCPPHPAQRMAKTEDRNVYQMMSVDVYKAPTILFVPVRSQSLASVHVFKCVLGCEEPSPSLSRVPEQGVLLASSFQRCPRPPSPREIGPAELQITPRLRGHLWAMSGGPAAGLGRRCFISKYNVMRSDNKHTTQRNKSLRLRTAVSLALAAIKSWNTRSPFQPNRIFKAQWTFVKMLNGAPRWRMLAYSSKQSTAAASASPGTFFKGNEEGKKEKNNKSWKERGKLVVVTRSPNKRPISSPFLGWGWVPLLPVLWTFF